MCRQLHKKGTFTTEIIRYANFITFDILELCLGI